MRIKREEIWYKVFLRPNKGQFLSQFHVVECSTHLERDVLMIAVGTVGAMRPSKVLDLDVCVTGGIYQQVKLVNTESRVEHGQTSWYPRNAALRAKQTQEFIMMIMVMMMSSQSVREFH